MPYDESSAEAEAGRRGEQSVDAWAARLGYSRLMVSDWGRKAVFIDAGGRAHAAFDRLYMAQCAKWVDVKWKTGPDHYRKQDVLRHGIDWPAFVNYTELVKVSGLEGHLAIVEIKRHRNSHEIAPVLLWQSITELNARIVDRANQVVDHATSGFPHGAIFWDRADFLDLGPIGIGDFPLPATRINLHPWERRDGDGYLRIPPNRPVQLSLSSDGFGRIAQ